MDLSRFGLVFVFKYCKMLNLENENYSCVLVSS